MTENEAIERIKTGICCEKGTARYCTDVCMYGEEKCAYSVAVKALEEIQQYRSIGTVEECRAAVEKQTQFKTSMEGLNFVIGICECGTPFDKDANYCKNCGKRIYKIEDMIMELEDMEARR